jgi:hypothetical protein
MWRFQEHVIGQLHADPGSFGEVAYDDQRASAHAVSSPALAWQTCSPSCQAEQRGDLV